MIDQTPNPITVILNIDSTSPFAHLYVNFCAIQPAPPGKMQWLVLRCRETRLDGPLLVLKVLDSEKGEFRLMVPASMVLLVVEGPIALDAKEIVASKP